jgi:hypothetical protein
MPRSNLIIGYERIGSEAVMSGSLTPTKAEWGWVIVMTPEMSQQAGVAENSLIVLHLAEGKVSAEILPPATAEMKDSVRQISEKFREAFEEMKRLGD